MFLVVTGSSVIFWGRYVGCGSSVYDASGAYEVNSSVGFLRHRADWA